MPIIEATQTHPKLNAESYALGSDGPATSDALLAADGRQWQPIK